MASNKRDFHDAGRESGEIIFRIKKSPEDVSKHAYDACFDEILEDILFELNLESQEEYIVQQNGVELNKKLSLLGNGIVYPYILDIVSKKRHSSKGIFEKIKQSTVQIFNLIQHLFNLTLQNKETVTFYIHLENNEPCIVKEIGTITAGELKNKYAEKTPFTAMIESYKVLVTHSDGKKVLLSDRDKIREHLADSNDCITFIKESSNQCSKEGDVYNLDFSKPGKVVIVNVDTFEKEENKRLGSEKDVESLRILFTKMGMEIEQYNENKDIYFIRKYLKEKIANADFTEYAMFVGVFMSHGNGDAMEGSDHDTINISEIVEIIDQIPSLQRKPKIFILQMCRGNMEDLRYHPQPQSGSVIRKFKSDNSNNRLICRLADCLIAQSTVPGYVSNRNISRGAWYIEELCKQLDASWETEDILTILTKVNKNMDLRQTSETQEGITYIAKQMSSLTSMLTKPLFLSKKKFFEQCLQIPESTKGSTKTEHIEIIQRNYPYLKEEIDAKFIYPLMCDEKIFTLEDKKEIENLTTRSARNAHFFNQLLQSRQDRTFDVFIEALFKIYPTVAETVVPKSGAMESSDGLPEIENLHIVQDPPVNML